MKPKFIRIIQTIALAKGREMKKCTVTVICVAIGVLLGKLFPSIEIPFPTNAQAQGHQPGNEIGLVQRMHRLELEVGKLSMQLRSSAQVLAIGSTTIDLSNPRALSKEVDLSSESPMEFKLLVARDEIDLTTAKIFFCVRPTITVISNSYTINLETIENKKFKIWVQEYESMESLERRAVEKLADAFSKKNVRVSDEKVRVDWVVFRPFQPDDEKKQAP